MDVFTKFDLDFRPETYWPEGFRPVVLEKRPPPVDEMDPSGEVYYSADGNIHYVQYPDEVEIAVIGQTKRDPGFRLCAHRGEDGRIHYRYILPHPDESSDPPFIVPGIISSGQPLMLGELVYSIDTTIVDDPDIPANYGLLAYAWNAEEAGDSPGSRRSASQGKLATSIYYPQLEERAVAVRDVFVAERRFPTLGGLPAWSTDVTFPADSFTEAASFLDDLIGVMSERPPSTFDSSSFDFEARPETYWPEGFTPFVAEPDAPPVHEMDAGGEVYADEDGRWHYVAFPDEVVLVTIGEANPEYLCARSEGDTIRFRWVMVMDAEVQRVPAMATPGITEADAPLSFGELVWLLDRTVISGDGYEPDTRGVMEWHWGIDSHLFSQRTDRMFAISGAPKIRSDVYPELQRYYQSVGGHYIQTGELFEFDERPG